MYSPGNIFKGFLGLLLIGGIISILGQIGILPFLIDIYGLASIAFFSICLIACMIYLFIKGFDHLTHKDWRDFFELVLTSIGNIIITLCCGVFILLPFYLGGDFGTYAPGEYPLQGNTFTQIVVAILSPFYLGFLPGLILNLTTLWNNSVVILKEHFQ
jgi:hypothetical protein